MKPSVEDEINRMGIAEGGIGYDEPLPRDTNEHEDVKSNVALEGLSSASTVATVKNDVTAEALAKIESSMFDLISGASDPSPTDPVDESDGEADVVPESVPLHPKFMATQNDNDRRRTILGLAKQYVKQQISGVRVSTFDGVGDYLKKIDGWNKREVMHHINLCPVYKGELSFTKKRNDNIIVNIPPIKKMKFISGDARMCGGSFYKVAYLYFEQIAFPIVKDGGKWLMLKKNLLRFNPVRDLVDRCIAEGKKAAMSVKLVCDNVELQRIDFCIKAINDAPCIENLVNAVFWDGDISNERRITLQGYLENIDSEIAKNEYSAECAMKGAMIPVGSLFAAIGPPGTGKSRTAASCARLFSKCMEESGTYGTDGVVCVVSPNNVACTSVAEVLEKDAGVDEVIQISSFDYISQIGGSANKCNIINKIKSSFFI